MADPKSVFDVFISHAWADRPLAEQIAHVCRLNGLSPFIDAQAVATGDDWADRLWEALSESRAVIAILSGADPTPSMAIELGGARAWNKPIFGVVTDPTVKVKPPSLRGVQIYNANRIEDVIRVIKRSGQEFSPKDRDVLASLYADLEVTVDQLALDPRHLEGLVRRFAQRTGKVVPGERLLSELLRMRKQGKLKKTAMSRQANRATGTE